MEKGLLAVILASGAVVFYESRSGGGAKRAADAKTTDAGRCGRVWRHQPLQPTLCDRH